MSSDEQKLRDLQHELARAWVLRDRVTLEAVLAPEWFVTTADGRLLTRATAIREAFAEQTDIVEIQLEDVTVQLYGRAAVVRGRSIGRGVSFATPLRFTHVFIKRGDQWQAVSAHASNAAT